MEGTLAIVKRGDPNAFVFAREAAAKLKASEHGGGPTSGRAGSGAGVSARLVKSR